AGKIAERTEVGHPFLRRRVVDLYWYPVDADTFPGAAHQHFYFKFVFGTEKTGITDGMQWVKPETGLCIGTFQPRFHIKPEVGKLVREGVLSRHVLLLQVPGADINGRSVRLQLFHE